MTGEFALPKVQALFLHRLCASVDDYTLAPGNLPFLPFPTKILQDNRRCAMLPLSEIKTEFCSKGSVYVCFDPR
jgi:hypothetical protein